MTDLNFTGVPEQGGSPENGFNWLALVTAFAGQQNTPRRRRRDGPRLDDLRLLLARPGTPITKVYGRMRIGGQLIWNGALREHISETGGGDKGGGGSGSPRQRQFHYSMHLAIGLCGRPISRIGRIWADGQLLDTSRVSMTLYHGTMTQEVDPLIEADMGVGRTPAYRGLAYVVMKDFDLTAYGNRVPQLSFEVFAPIDDRQDVVRGVALLPGASEFGYHPDPHIQLLGIGRAGSENVNAHAGLSDWDLSLNELQDTYSECRQVALVVSWFGTDLRAAHCRLEPRVENKTKDTLPTKWSVAGLDRATASVVSYVNNRPAFGGTPSDASVLAAIRDLKRRGFDVLFYPFIMMDIAADNDLPDPHSEGFQPAYPWRGRITCDPAPAREGSPHGTPVIADMIDNFVHGQGADDLFCLRGMVRHYAELCAQAGGVEGFLLGSELRGLSALRSSDTVYPFAAALVDLSQEVRAILPETKISYAADWSEYGARVEADGFVDFPLDEFWSHEQCDFIAIDAYFPLSDWRDGQAHLDAQSGVASITDNDYLQANIEGGEYYDWHYRDDAARRSQDRSLISDGADNAEVWLYRAKDIHGWWSNRHRPRRQNQSQAPTAWVAQSKPIWFSEVGCPAVDKGSNQPNVFPDHLSSEGAVPHFSNGQRDDHIQRAYLTAFSNYYRQAAHNPTSSIYHQPMVASDKIFIWAWDARPFPAFPYRTDIWADGPNWHSGHWINGRSSTAPLALLLEQVASDANQASDICEIDGHVEGYAVVGVVSARDALAPLVNSFAVDVLTGRQRLKFSGRANKPVCPIELDDIIWQGQSSSLRYHQPNEAALPRRLDLHYIDAENDYGAQCVSAHYLGGERPVVSVSIPIALSSYTAQSLAARLLHETRQSAETLSVRLSPAYIKLEPGDIIQIGQKQWRVTQISLAGYVELTATRHQAGLYQSQLTSVSTQAAPLPLGVVSRPMLQVLDLPARLPLRSQPANEAGQPLLASFADPWPGDVQIRDQNGAYLQSLFYPASLGQTKSRLAAGPIGRWDGGGRLQVEIHGAILSSLTPQQVLQGGNVLALQTPQGWEVMQFVNAELIAPNHYLLSVFLRGQNGSEAVMADVLEAGAAVVVLTPQLVPLDLAPTQLSRETSLLYGPSALPREGYGWQSGVFTTKRVGLICLAPAHLRQRVDANGNIDITWIRRSRLAGDDFEAAEIPLGETHEAYQVSVMADDDIIFQSQTQVPQWTYEASLRAQHQAAHTPRNWRIGVAQISATQGAGYQSRAIII